MSDGHIVRSHGPGASSKETAWVLWAACGSVVLAAVLLAGLFASGMAGFSSLQTASPLSAAVGRSQAVGLTVVTTAGPQKDWPAFVPSSFSIPAGQLVTVTNLDNATALPAGLSAHLQVTGVVGDEETIAPLHAAGSTPSQHRSRRVTTVNENAVSHTFTIPSLRINVPIPARSTATFTIRVAEPGAYGWMCFDPCGGGTGGFGTPMGLAGYMAGTVTATPT